MVKYIVSDGDGEEDENEDEDDWYESSYWTVFRVEEDGTKVEVGWIGGEPEDNTAYRSYGWVEGALNDAYQRGWKAGIKEGYDLAEDLLTPGCGANKEGNQGSPEAA